MKLRVSAHCIKTIKTSGPQQFQPLHTAPPQGKRFRLFVGPIAPTVVTLTATLDCFVPTTHKNVNQLSHPSSVGSCPPSLLLAKSLQIIHTKRGCCGRHRGSHNSHLRTNLLFTHRQPINRHTTRSPQNTQSPRKPHRTNILVSFVSSPSSEGSGPVNWS